MTRKNRVKRREFLHGAGMSLLGMATGGVPLSQAQSAPGAGLSVRIASNPGLENATLNKLMETRGFFARCGVEATIVEARGARGPLQSLVAGNTDICLVSGYNRIIPDIANGAPVKIVAGAMLPPAHAIYSASDSIRSLHDLVGKDVGVGAMNGLLHALMVLRLQKAGIDPRLVRFHDKGSNAEVYKAVVAGEVDAGAASVSNLPASERDGIKVVTGGNLWVELPEYTFQTAYASDRAIRENREALVRTLAACSLLYRFLQSPGSRSGFFAARRAVQEKFDEAAAAFTWQFIQEYQPYAVGLVISEQRLNYLQDLNLLLGTQRRRLPTSEIADMSLARSALAFLDKRGASRSNFYSRR